MEREYKGLQKPCKKNPDNRRETEDLRMWTNKEAVTNLDQYYQTIKVFSYHIYSNPVSYTHLEQFG